MGKIQIAIIIFAIIAIIAVPTITYFASTAAPSTSEHEEHEFSNTWKTNETSHWKTCSGAGCKEVDSKADHIFGDGVVKTPATEATAGVMSYKCVVCGYEKTEAIEKLTHEHTWENEWTNDETYHWHKSTCGHDDSEMIPHVYDDGFVDREPTDTQPGIMIYTCAYCNYSYQEETTPTTHYHVYQTTWTYDENNHWHASACGHNNIKGKEAHKLGAGQVVTEPTEFETGLRVYPCETCDYEKEEEIPKLTHVHNFVNGVCTGCGMDHEVCSACGKCEKQGCTECAEQCAFINHNYVVNFAPNSTYLGKPEGPDGKYSGEEGQYAYDMTIQASQVVLDNGAHATKVTLPNGTAANSGVSFYTNQGYNVVGPAGFSCAIPQYKDVPTPIRMHFTNTGSSALKFKFSIIDYGNDYGAVTVELAAGESKVVEFISTFEKDTVGQNQQIVFLDKAEKGASLTMWGEFVAGEAEYLTLVKSADKLFFKEGDTFTAEGLIFTMNRGNTDKSSNLYNRVYINDNYTTNLDGYTFTRADAVAGKKTVTVTFAGKTITYDVVIADHDHNLTLVSAVAPVACTTDGTEAYYKCSISGCGKIFSDSQGFNQISAPEKISCHTAPTGANYYPGTTVQCTKCTAKVAASTDNWVLFTLPTSYCTSSTDCTKESCKYATNIKNSSIEYGEVNGMPGTIFHIGAGTVGATPSSAFHLKMGWNASDRQTIIPNVGANAADGTTRTIVLYYVNYSDVDITMNFQNDSGGSKGMCKVTIPANGTATGSFTMNHKQNGSNWFDYYVDFTPSKDVSFGVYGYFYLNEGETRDASVNAASTHKTVYTVGEKFSTEGLIISASCQSPLYAYTGYTTNLDGHIFTAADIGTKTVTVDFAGAKVTYVITVKAAE